MSMQEEPNRQSDQSLEGTDDQQEEQSLLSELEFNEMVEQMCNSKAQEFHMMGYEQVTGTDIWKCVSSKYKKELPPLHRLVNDILTLKSNSFMNWLMIEAYKG